MVHEVVWSMWFSAAVHEDIGKELLKFYREENILWKQQQNPEIYAYG